MANIIDGDLCTIVILVDKSDFVYRKLRQAKGDLPAILQERRPDATQVIVTTRIKDKNARAAIEPGGTVMIFRGKYHKEEDGSIYVLLLADASEFVYHRLKRRMSRSCWQHARPSGLIGTLPKGQVVWTEEDLVSATGLDGIFVEIHKF